MLNEALVERRATPSLRRFFVVAWRALGADQKHIVQVSPTKLVDAAEEMPILYLAKLGVYMLPTEILKCSENCNAR